LGRISGFSRDKYQGFFMKKLLFFIFAALFCAGALIMSVVIGCAGPQQVQPPTTPQSGNSGTTTQVLPKIAVYVTGNVGADEKEALGTRILTSLVNSGRYIAIERSNAFLAEIEKEHVKQRSGDIDDSQISALGKQFGVKFVCIAAITPAFGDFQVSARIVDVETAVVVYIGDASSPLKSMENLERVSDQVVKNMFSGQTTPVSTPVSKPAPPLPSGASIFIATLPAKAEIYINERHIGTSNAGILQVPVGTHQVRFVKGNVEKTMSMTFQPGENPTKFVTLK
jgi:hypothetical protein